MLGTVVLGSVGDEQHDLVLKTVLHHFLGNLVEIVEPDFAARVTFSDGATVTFDGPKDLFTFLLDVAKYAPGRNRSDVDGVLVTEYYALAAIDAETALFVVGSDVHGPMGAELIPFAQRLTSDKGYNNTLTRQPQDRD